MISKWLSRLLLSAAVVTSVACANRLKEYKQVTLEVIVPNKAEVVALLVVTADAAVLEAMLANAVATCVEDKL